MKILVCNWRDIKNPRAGGAETLTHEMASRWAKEGHIVVQISAKFPGCKSEETIDGVTFVRRGSWWNVSFFAWYYYTFILRGEIDAIVDEVHWFPYFTRLYAPEKTVLLACEVANKRFFTLFPAPIARIWRLFELLYVRLYRNVPTMAISPSTKSELISHGFPARHITVIPMGLTVPASFSPCPKEKVPTVIFLGRLNKLKGVYDAVNAFKIIKTHIPESVLWLVGSGEQRTIEHVAELINKYSISGSVVFHGFVSEQKKFELLSRGHVLIVPSIHEGWGLIVHEAAFAGTPSVVYDVPGLRDTLIDGKTGFIVRPDPESLAGRTVTLLTNQFIYRGIESNARHAAQKLTWDKTAETALECVKRAMK